MNKFTHGIMIIDPVMPLENGDYEVIHFVGYWKKPTDWNVEADRLKEELRNDPEFKLKDVVDRLLFYPATEDCLKHYNEMGEADGIFNDNKLWNEKLN